LTTKAKNYVLALRTSIERRNALINPIKERGLPSHWGKISHKVLAAMLYVKHGGGNGEKGTDTDAKWGGRRKGSLYEKTPTRNNKRRRMSGK